MNLFSAHAYDRLKIAPKGGWAWTVDPKQVAEKARNGLAKGTPFAKADVGTRLAMFLQIRDTFGWQPIAALLKSYSDDHDRSPELLPRTNDEERDQLCVRLSNILNRNLYPFLHDLWGIEISDAARDKVSNLLPWMPEGFVANS